MGVYRPPDRAVIERAIFERAPLECARDLIGCTLANDAVAGKIVETEAYDAEDDPACHTFFRPSTRAFVAGHPPGTAYIYLNYGVHWLFNILVKGDRTGFVLVRALEPVSGQETMAVRRRSTVEKSWCSGPGKLTQALGITGEHHGIDIPAHPSIQLVPRISDDVRIIADPRIGISAARDFPWRFTLEGSRYVSKPVRMTRESCEIVSHQARRKCKD